MRRKILILLLWGFPLCFCGGTEFPEYSFAPSANECFVVDNYGSALVGSKERPYSGDFWEDLADYVRIHGGIFTEPDTLWVSYVDPDYWEEFLSVYPEYYDDVKNYFNKHPDAPNNPFRLSLIDDIGAIMGMILMGITYGIFAYRMRRQ